MKSTHWLLLLLLGTLASCQKEAPPATPQTAPPVAPAPAPAPGTPAAIEPKIEASPAPTPQSKAAPAPVREKKQAAAQPPAKAAEAATPAPMASVAKAEPAAKPEPVKPAEPVQVLKISDADFEAKVLQAPGPVLVYVVAPWCAPCVVGAKVIDEIATEYAGRMKVMTMDIKAGDQTVKRYKVEGLPTTLIFKKGKVEGTNLGWKTRADLTAFVEGTL